MRTDTIRAAAVQIAPDLSGRAGTIERVLNAIAEAADKGISILDHATHLIVHGTFHLLGYDHMDDAEAEAMEALEIAALASLGLADPYGDRNDI